MSMLQTCVENKSIYWVILTVLYGQFWGMRAMYRLRVWPPCPWLATCDYY